jgi:hypothetical protein
VNHFGSSVMPKFDRGSSKLLPLSMAKVELSSPKTRKNQKHRAFFCQLLYLGAIHPSLAIISNRRSPFSSARSVVDCAASPQTLRVRTMLDQPNSRVRRRGAELSVSSSPSCTWKGSFAAKLGAMVPWSLMACSRAAHALWRGASWRCTSGGRNPAQLLGHAQIIPDRVMFADGPVPHSHPDTRYEQGAGRPCTCKPKGWITFV